jgi:hypothetical protein
MEQDDPEAYRSEVLGEFRAGLSSAFDPEAIAACVIPGRRELPPAAELRYSAFVDAGGSGKGSFTVAIGHRTGERITVDALRAWPPPFNPSGVVEECAALVKGYGTYELTGDRYAGECPREQFRSRGVAYKPRRRTGPRSTWSCSNW